LHLRERKTHYASTKAGAEALVHRIRQAGGKAVAVQADVSKLEDIRRLLAETKKSFGKLDILVNNAGIYEFAPLEAITAEHFRK
jgi:3-oxoacyl-[acyl-carrier protein] reductase